MDILLFELHWHKLLKPQALTLRFQESLESWERGEWVEKKEVILLELRAKTCMLGGDSFKNTLSNSSLLHPTNHKIALIALILNTPLLGEQISM